MDFLRRGGILTIALLFATCFTIIGCGGDEGGGTTTGGTTGDVSKTDGGGTDGGGDDGGSTDGGGDAAPEHPWAGFKVGDFAEYETNIETAGTTMTTGTKNTITEVTDEKVVYEAATTMTIAGKEQVTKNTAEVPLKVEDTGEKTGDEPETGDETITVAAGEFDCKWTLTKTGGNETKIWMSSKVPGGVVKMEMTGASKMTMELKSYQGK